MKWFILRALVLGLLCFWGNSFAQSPPINDNFENRIILSGNPVTFTGTLANATIEDGERMRPPALYLYRNNTASVWWSWTAPATGPTTMEVLNSSTNAFKLGGMDIWTGTNWPTSTDYAIDFVQVGHVNLDTGSHPFLTFSAIAGTTYHLRVLGTNYGDFTLKITGTNTPLVVVQPASRTVTTNGSTYFGVVAAGALSNSPPFSYQWRFNGIDLPGETFPILGLDHLTTNQSGGYSVVVSNQTGGTVSEVAILKVTESVEPPQLMAVGSSEGGFEFKILGDVGRIYRIESSTNLTDWAEEKSFPAEFVFYDTVREKNGLVFSGPDRFSVPKSSQRRFYRATPYFPSDEVCINNLRKIRFAKEIWSLEEKVQSYWTTPALTDIDLYLKGGVPTCPLAPPDWPPLGSYVLNNRDISPYCRISTAHLLEEPEY